MRVDLTVTPSAEGGQYITGSIAYTPAELVTLGTFLVAGGASSANNKWTPNELAGQVALMVKAIEARIRDRFPAGVIDEDA